MHHCLRRTAFLKELGVVIPNKRSIASTIVIALVGAAAATAAGQTTLYVDDDAAAGGDGLSWVSAMTYLQDALAAAELDPTIDEIRVAAGTYYPDEGAGITPGDQTQSFYLVDGVRLMGGYAGPGTPDPDERDPDVYVTTLTGDLADNDVGGYGDVSHNENTYYVVRATGVSASSQLNGFDVQSGYATYAPGTPGSTTAIRKGAGLQIINSSAVIGQCRFVDNLAYDGGAIYVSGGVPTINDCVFLGNVAASSDEDTHGGAVRVYSGTPTIRRCYFENNSAASPWYDSLGGAVATRKATWLVDCTFVGNTAIPRYATSDYAYGGAVYSSGWISLVRCSFAQNSATGKRAYGGAVSVSSTGSVTFSQCTFDQNLATGERAYGGAVRSTGPIILSECAFTNNDAAGPDSYGGALYIEGDTTVDQSTFVGNIAQLSGGALFVYSGATQVDRSIIEDNASPTGGAISTLSVNAVTLESALVYDNRGTQSATIYAAAGALDVRNCTIVQNVAISDGIIHVNGADVTLRNTILWNSSSPELNVSSGTLVATYSNAPTPGVGNMYVNPVFVAPGLGNFHLQRTSPCIDRAENAVFAPGFYVDLDGAQRFVDVFDVPDGGTGQPPIVDMGVFEFRDDCNANCVADGTDIAAATSLDCNANGIPDECEPDRNTNGIQDECEADCNGNEIPDIDDIAAGTSQDCNGDSVPDGCDIIDGTSTDCNTNNVPDECDLAAGTSNDCNGNLVSDACDVVDGTSADCSGDGIPDECDSDCNGNGFPDSCDIESGTSFDCQPNAIPDSCDIAMGTSTDLDMNGSPDECACGPMNDCNDHDVCTVDECAVTYCVNKPFTVYGDVNNDGFASVSDALCILDDFGGNPNSSACIDPNDGLPVSYEEKDIAPCPSPGDSFNVGDGFVSVNDALAVLDVFGCSCGNADLWGCYACNLALACPQCGP